MKTFKKYMGLTLIVIGAITLIIGHFIGAENSNILQFSALGLIIAGIPTHIIVTKRDVTK